jgi:hypothetical protein
VNRSDEPKPKLNLFALPNQTTLFFVLIVGVILLAVTASLFGSPVCGWPIVIGMLVLPLRDFLRKPGRQIERYTLTRAEAGLTRLRFEIERLSQQAGLRCFPRLLTTKRHLGLFAFGSFRRCYLAADYELARKIEDLLHSPNEGKRQRARVLFLHELHHFTSGDVWMMNYAHSLLKSAVAFMSWSLVFLVGMIILAFVYGPQAMQPDFLDSLGLDATMRAVLGITLPSSQEMAAMLEKSRTIDFGLASLYVANAHLPFIISGIVLFVFFWRRLVQVRELYADAGAARSLQDSAPVRDALVWYGAWRTIQRAKVLPGSVLDRFKAWINRLLPFHPSLKSRRDCLDEPICAYGSVGWVGLTVGLLVLLLDLILVGPFTLYHLSSMPVHFATIASFVTIAVWLLPTVAQGCETGRQIASRAIGAVLLATGIRSGWLLLNVGFVVILLIASPEMLRQILNEMVITGAGVVGQGVPFPLDEPPDVLVAQIIGGALALTALIFVALSLFLSLAVYLKRLAFTWYGLSHTGKRLIMVCWGIIATLGIVLVGLVLTPGTALILGDVSIGSMVMMALSALVGGIGIWWFARTHRCYGRRCPVCGGEVPDWFTLGRRCPHCEAVLHPWLLADY